MEVTSHLEYRFSSIGHPAVWDNCIAAARSHAMYMSHVIRLRYCTRTRTSGHGLLVCQNSGGILPEVLGLLVLAFWWISKFSARTRTRTLRPNSGSGSGDYPTSGKHWLQPQYCRYRSRYNSTVGIVASTLQYEYSYFTIRVRYSIRILCEYAFSPCDSPT